jgi:HAD superfamily hydrolase (TIGR01484 family)
MEASRSIADGKVQLVALDLDGTTLNSGHELTSKTVDVLRRLSEKGVTIAIATGRSAPSVFGYVDSLALGKNVPVICYNGSFGFMVETNDDGTHSSPRQLFSMPVDEERARLLLNLAEKMGLVAQV